MKLSKDKFRLLLLGTAITLVLFAYILRLLQMQVVDGEEYLLKMTQGSSRAQTVVAARGEIVDRHGSPFVFNQIGFDLVLDRALMPAGINNLDLLKLIEICQSYSEEWVDTLPISKTEPFVYMTDEKEVSKLRAFLNIAEYATAPDAVHWLIERYNLSEMPIAQARLVAGVRYEMEIRGFSLSNRYVFAREIPIEAAVYLRQFSNQIPGVDIVEAPVRSYMDPSLAPHLVGRIGPVFANELEAYLEKGYSQNDLVGKEGIERAFEEQLRGKDGTRRVYLNAEKQVIDVVEEKPPTPGNTVTLTIDKNLQQIALDSLEKQIKFLNETAIPGQGREADTGAVAAVDIKTGEILVLASYPSYDITRYTEDYDLLNADPLLPLFNRALMGQYRPGSIFKPVVALAGLNENVITSTTTIPCNRVYSFYPSYQPTCLGYHGNVTVRDALRVSCNVFFYDTGRLLGIEKMNDYARQFGLGVPTGIELGENIGTQSDPKTKDPGDVLQAAIGQMGNYYSPLQLANYTATIARKGERLNLSIIHSVSTYNFEETIQKHSPEVVQTINASSAYFDTVIDGMIQASHIGTAQRTFGNYPVKVASKTGTPQTHDLPNSTFIAFAPADDPQIAIAVIIEKGWHGYTGAPVARDIFDAALFPESSSPKLVVPDNLLR